MRSGDMQFFYDYVNEFMKNDPKLKDCKVLSAIVHFDEVHFPRSEYDDEGKWVRDYTDAESMALAYIPVHMHVNYIPLTKVQDKEGKDYLKLSHKEIWKIEKGRYWQSFKEFNDRQYSAVGKKYGLSRGNIWEDWKTRIQEAENGKKAKKKKDLTDFIMEQEQKRVDGIKKQQAQLQEEVSTLELSVKEYQVRIDRLKAQHIEEEQRQKELIRKTKIVQADYIKKISEYNKACEELAEAYKLLEADEQELIQRESYVKNMYEALDEKARYLVNIELALSRNEINMDDAKAIAKHLSLDDKLDIFRNETAKERTPYLYELANQIER